MAMMGQIKVGFLRKKFTTNSAPKIASPEIIVRRLPKRAAM
jgi:hypothetical protein